MEPVLNLVAKPMAYSQIPKYCRSCLERLARQAMHLACVASPENEALALSWLEELYAPEIPPPLIASLLHRRIKKYCQNPDPYRPLKEKEIEIAQRMARLLRPYYKDSFEELLLFSLLGNALDFFRPLEEVEEAFKKGVKLSIDDRPTLSLRLAETKRLLFLPDNAGEIFFDLPLLAWLQEQNIEVFYAVKPVPIQNDLSLEDLKRLDLDIPARVISTGAEMVGLSLTEASEEFLEIFETADLILAKGMGHFETLSELARPNLAFLLCAKCVPVSKALGVELNSYVVKLS